MTEKPEGKINEVVYNHTAYMGGERVIFLTTGGLYHLIDDLIKANATTEYLRITPFYRNPKINRQREFDELMFFMECRESVTEEEEMAEILEEINQNSLMDLPAGKALRPMCRFDDPEKFGRALTTYCDYLNTAIPQMFAIAKEELNLSEEDLGFGYFCFEIHSG